MASGGNFIDKVFDQLSAGDSALNAPEKFFDSLGMMRGSYAPLYRGAFGFAAAELAWLALRPGVTFDKDGKPLAKPTVPIWAPGVAAGAFCALFI